MEKEKWIAVLEYLRLYTIVVVFIHGFYYFDNFLLYFVSAKIPELYLTSLVWKS